MADRTGMVEGCLRVQKSESGVLPPIEDSNVSIPACAVDRVLVIDEFPTGAEAGQPPVKNLGTAVEGRLGREKVTSLAILAFKVLTFMGVEVVEDGGIAKAD